MKRSVAVLAALLVCIAMCSCGKGNDHEQPAAFTEAGTTESTAETFSESEEDTDRLEETPQESAYSEAMELLAAEKYEEALTIFAELGDYADSMEKGKECENGIFYDEGVKLVEAGEYAEAMKAFKAIYNPYRYKNGAFYMNLCNKRILMAEPMFAVTMSALGIDLKEEDIESGFYSVGGTGIGPDGLQVLIFPKNYQRLTESCVFEMKNDTQLKLPMTLRELYDAGWKVIEDNTLSKYSFVDGKLEDPFPEVHGPVNLRFGNSRGMTLLAHIERPESETATLGDAELARFDVSSGFNMNGITQNSTITDVLEKFGMPYSIEHIIFSGDINDVGSIYLEYYGNAEERKDGYLVFSFDAQKGKLNQIGYAGKYCNYHI